MPPAPPPAPPAPPAQAARPRRISRRELRSRETLQIEARTAVTMLAAPVDLDAIVDDHARLLESMMSGNLELACRDARDHQWHYADLPHDAQGRSRSTA